MTHYVTYFLLLMCSFCACANEQFPDPKWEYSQKAKIIRYLTEIVTWPTSSNANQNFNVCLVGKFSHVSILKQLDKKPINGRVMRVYQLKNALASGQQCHIIYLSKSQAPRFNKIIDYYEKKPILLIADIPEFADIGGNMNFIMINPKKVGLTINLERMEACHLQVNLDEFEQFTIFPKKSDLEENNFEK